MALLLPAGPHSADGRPSPNPTVPMQSIFEEFVQKEMSEEHVRIEREDAFA